MLTDAPDRVASLDLIRGVAVLGILTVNIAGFAGPPGATVTPHVPHPGTRADEIAFAITFVLFEGKMRALFTVLFGASLTLFIERTDARGEYGEVLQMRRLFWLLLFGALHFFLLWWGDILFAYAISGILVLFLRDLPPRALVLGAVLAFVLWHLQGAFGGLAATLAEEHVRLSAATVAEARDHADFLSMFAQRDVRELAEVRLGYLDQIGAKLSHRPFRLLESTWSNLGETVPLMLIGAALQRGRFFAGAWPRRRMLQLAGTGLTLGVALTLPLLAWLWQRHFPPQATSQAVLYWTALPHVLLALAYAALLVLATPRLAGTGLGQRLAAAGRMAFSNYIGTTMLMTAIFYGWGLGLVGQVGHAPQIGFVGLGWVIMLSWSKPWLGRFRQGPLEWLWRSLTERRFLPIRR